LPLCSAGNYATKTLCATTTFVAFWDKDSVEKMRKPTPISELLTQGKAKLERLRSGAERAGETLIALQQALPADAASHVWGASLDGDGILTVVVDSGGWATRLRYAVPEFEPKVARALKRDVVRTVVRVRPRAG
jgi:hypothetical protein